MNREEFIKSVKELGIDLNEDMIKEFKKGDVIFREGETGDTLYQIKEGEVCVYAGYDGDGGGSLHPGEGYLDGA